MFDKLWHLIHCAVAPVPLDRRAQSATRLTESFLHLCFTLPLSAAISDFQSLERGDCGRVMEERGGVSLGLQTASALVCRSVMLPPEQTERLATCQFPPFHSSTYSLAPLFVPFAFHPRRATAPQLQDRLVSQCTSE